MDVQPGDGEVDRHPDAVLLGAQVEAVPGMEDHRLMEGLVQALHTALSAEAEQVRRGETEQFGAGKPVRRSAVGLASRSWSVCGSKRSRTSPASSNSAWANPFASLVFMPPPARNGKDKVDVRVQPAGRASNPEVIGVRDDLMFCNREKRRTAMDLQARIQQAVKVRDELARDLLRVILGEVSTRKARTGKEPRDEEVHAIIRSMIANNNETRKELEQRGQTAHEVHERLARENVYLETLLPRTLDQAAIQKELEPIVAELKAAKSDGQATGLAMKHLKPKGLAVLGEDVASVVRRMRTG